MKSGRHWAASGFCSYLIVTAFVVKDSSNKQVNVFPLQRGWTLPPDGFFHFQCEKKDMDEVIPAKMLAEQTIEYARELEMIV
jgi:hypothetical protein